MTRFGRRATLTVAGLGALGMLGATAAALLPPRARVTTPVALRPPAKAPTRARPHVAPAIAARAAPAPEGTVIRHVLPIDHAMKFGESHWDEAGAPATGPIVITVDLQAQVLSIFRGGWEIGTAVVLYGAGKTPTPLGVFHISQKDADHHSNIYSGAPMPYMLRLTNDGISIHGSLVADGYATHGCVGVPKAFAKQLFGQAHLGDKVIVTNGEKLGVGGAITAA